MGFILTFYLIFINKVIQKSLPSDITPENLNLKIAIVFLFQGIGSISMGIAQSKIPLYYKSNKRKYYAVVM